MPCSFQVNASLKEITEERDAIKQTLQIEVEARKEMEGKLSMYNCGTWGILELGYEFVARYEFVAKPK